MRTWIAALLFALTAVLPGVARAQGGPVTATATVAPAPVRPGEYLVVTVDAKIAAPYHIYSNVPVVGDGPLAPTLRLEAGERSLDAAPAGESAPTVKFDKGFKKDVGTHAGAVSLRYALKVPADTKPGPWAVVAKFRYQACDEGGCLSPKTLTLPFSGLRVEAGAARIEYNTPPVSGTSSTVAPGPTPETPPQDTDWLSFLAAAFVGGLLTLLTPCVFPMIPVTLAFFTKQATQPGATAADRAGVVKLAVLYAVGIIVAFTAMGVVLAAVLKNASAARNFAINPWVNVTFAILFVVFGLALLELFELRLPSKLQALGGKRSVGTLGVLGMGLTFVVSAFTCTAPIVGSLLVVAAKATGAAAFMKPVVGMSTFALALSLPFLLLALFPSLLARLPRSGTWMTTIKGAMGFLELAAAVKFLSTADLYWNWQLLTQPLFLALWGLILVASGFWLLGLLQIGFNTPSGQVTAARGISAGLFIGLGVYCLYGVSGKPLHRNINQFLPPPMSDYGPFAGKSGSEIAFLGSLEEAKRQAAAQKKPLFVEFTGHTCSNCRDVETNVMPIPAVREQLDRFVRVRLYTDPGQHETPENADRHLKLMQDTFGDAALPLYIALEPDGTTKIATTNYTTSKDAGPFTDWLTKAAGKQ